ncbi:uncharacterized protein A4U43_C04F7090 [Asparagus officinalis]|uniref:Uncharacterized protein n=1 Tax=Asparagus officinalis TaxID=4686 RepID=A0A5P1EZJ3_ASPOF|nr:uncharacterized protein A4U43_C04F7090 [Asparagus officinalis]
MYDIFGRISCEQYSPTELFPCHRFTVLHRSDYHSSIRALTNERDLANHVQKLSTDLVSLRRRQPSSKTVVPHKVPGDGVQIATFAEEAELAGDGAGTGGSGEVTVGIAGRCDA